MVEQKLARTLVRFFLEPGQEKRGCVAWIRAIHRTISAPARGRGNNGVEPFKSPINSAKRVSQGGQGRDAAQGGTG